MRNKTPIVGLLLGSLLGLSAASVASAEVKLLTEVKLNDESMYFDGKQVPKKEGSPENPNGPYDYAFGNSLVPHGDCIKVFENFVFLTWYRGGKQDRHVMLTRLNTDTGSMKTIEFPHRHTGFLNQWWIGESHNTIAVGISPKNGTIHLLYDMHAYSSTRPKNGSLAKDYFRYSYSVDNAATVPDEEFNLDLFVKSPDGDLKHLTMSGRENESVWGGLTYPKFFLNDEGELLMYMREGGNNNGKYVFSAYDGRSRWADPIDFNELNAKRRGNDVNYGVYGEWKYAAGKIRVGFQKRSGDNDDRYLYQNGIYYAYSDDPTGRSRWKNADGRAIDLPVVNPEIMKVFEPGDLVESNKKNQVYMVGGFDFNVTDRGDEHFVARVIDRENDVTKHVHVYRAAGDRNFKHTTDFPGAAELYASGDSILLITLQKGRPFIQRTEGGTHNWKTIYENESGRRFDKGIPYIIDGKLYYYLREPGSGDKRTTYLQVIDLDLGSL